MIGVLVLVAVLLIVRAASIVWMAEEARAWWQERERVAMRYPVPVAAAPAPARDRPLAMNPVAQAATGDEAAWITPDDYPAESLRYGEQGTVQVSWTIRADGRVIACRTVASSGFARLDAAACRAITERGRYRPARDAAGRAIAMSKTRRVRWQLPS